MAIAVLGFACRSQLTFRRPLVFCVHKVRHSSSVAAVEWPAEPIDLTKEAGSLPVASRGGVDGEYKAPEWKKVSSKDLGIKTSMITKPTRLVLNGLRKKGYDVYLVGGCVRDLILKRTPKNFDILTSAELKEIQRTFTQCVVVGKRFPICHVHVNDTIVEVSSFSTAGRKSGRNLNHVFKRPAGCDKRDYIHWKNCLQQDFTINGLMFDPYSKIVYDYMGGMEDIRNAEVQTVIPANTSFVEDCVRIAARLGFHFTREIAHSVRQLSRSVLRLDKGRILMEINYMLVFGSADALLRLLWRSGLLEILLPIQSLFSNLDRLVAPDRPCHSSLWVGILAFHKALVGQPREPLVVAAFTLAVHSGGSLLEAMNIARRISHPHDVSFHELLECQAPDLDETLINEVMDLAASVKDALCEMTDEYFVSRAMTKYPQAPHSDLVFIPLALSLRVSKIFECVRMTPGKQFVPR